MAGDSAPKGHVQPLALSHAAPMDSLLLGGVLSIAFPARPSLQVMRRQCGACHCWCSESQHLALCGFSVRQAQREEAGMHVSLPHTADMHETPTAWQPLFTAQWAK